MISLLTPLINASVLAQKLALLGTIIQALEFICMTIYDRGGKGLRQLLGVSENVRLPDRISGCLMIGVGLWLFFG